MHSLPCSIPIKVYTIRIFLYEVKLINTYMASTLTYAMLHNTMKTQSVHSTVFWSPLARFFKKCAMHTSVNFAVNTHIDLAII